MLANVDGAWRSTELLACYQRTFNPTHNNMYVQACVHSFHAIHKHSVRPQLPKANASDAINNDARLPLVGFRPRINSENQRSLAAALFFSCEFLGAAWCSSDFFATLKLPFFATGRRPSLRLAVALLCDCLLSPPSHSGCLRAPAYCTAGPRLPLAAAAAVQYEARNSACPINLPGWNKHNSRLTRGSAKLDPIVATC